MVTLGHVLRCAELARSEGLKTPGSRRVRCGNIDASSKTLEDIGLFDTLRAESPTPAAAPPRQPLERASIRRGRVAELRRTLRHLLEKNDAWQEARCNPTLAKPR